jgi:hypothetical protein
MRQLRKIRLFTVVMIIVLFFVTIFSLPPNSHAQTVVTFDAYAQFNIPVLNGTISFAYNGTYAKATLENDTWVFENLHFSRSSTLKKFQVSAQNSNVTIFSYTQGNISNFGNIRLSYSVKGIGKQTINLGLTQSSYVENANRQWAVVVSNFASAKNVQNYNYLTEGKDWRLMNDGTFRINGLPGNTTLVRYSYSTGNSNLPFYVQHSVIITATVSFAVAILAIVLIKRKIAVSSGEE